MSSRHRMTPQEEAEVAKRRTRNRLSQRHFRERKSNYIKELEDRLQATQLNESDRNKVLVEEATELRSAVLKLRSQIATIANDLENVSNDIGRILNVDQGRKGRMKPVDGSKASSSDDEVHENEDLSTPVAQIPIVTTSDEPLLSEMTAEHANSLDDFGLTVSTLDRAGADKFPTSEHTQPQTDSFDFCPEIDTDAMFDNIQMTSELPDTLLDNTMNLTAGLSSQNGAGVGAWPNEEQTSFMPSIITPPSIGFSLPPGHFPPPRELFGAPQFRKVSMFSQHVEALELAARQRLNASPSRSSSLTVHKCCSSIIFAFVNGAWPQTRSVWFQSRVPDIIRPILSWRVQPTIQTYQELMPEYRPTQIQLREPHSAVIDWVPYAPLRDRIILFYNGSSELDRLICDTLDSFVVEVEDVAKVLPGAAPGRAYFGIWNVFSALDTTSRYANIDQSHLATVPSLNYFDMQPSPAGTMGFDNHPNSFDGANFLTSLENHETLSTFSGPCDLSQIFSSHDAVVQFSNDIKLQQATTWRLDRAFFEKWPELKFNGYEDIVARGRSYRIPAETPRAPTGIAPQVIQAYQAAIRDSI